jgi:hypothetical protein
MAKKDLQQIFDHVALHLITQGKRSQFTKNKATDSSVCAYRGPGGLSCAVGCLIADEHYDHGLEGNGALSSWVLDALKASGVPVKTHTSYAWGERSPINNLLEDLQALHDCADPKTWPDVLIQVADEYDLSAAILGE